MVSVGIRVQMPSLLAVEDEVLVATLELPLLVVLLVLLLLVPLLLEPPPQLIRPVAPARPKKLSAPRVLRR